MRLRTDQLKQHLAGKMLPVYLVTGDEPLQQLESCDLIRAAAKQQGCSERDVLTADKNFEWSDLLYSGASMSLFGDRKLIDLRVPGGKPGKPGGQALVEYAEKAGDSQDILLITMPKIDKAATSSKWFKTLDQLGAVVQIWPVETQQMSGWVMQRLKMKGVNAPAEVAAVLAERSEGNLLAAAQEVDKLALLFANQAIGLEQALEAITDSSRYDVYQWIDALLLGDLKKATRILNGLKAEGVDAIVANWALAREMRQMHAMMMRLRNTNQNGVFQEFRVWPKRQPVVSEGLRRLNLKRCETLLTLSARVDREIKGMAPGNPWTTLAQAGVIFCKQKAR